MGVDGLWSWLSGFGGQGDSKKEEERKGHHHQARPVPVQGGAGG